MKPALSWLERIAAMLWPLLPEWQFFVVLLRGIFFGEHTASPKTTWSELGRPDLLRLYVFLGFPILVALFHKNFLVSAALLALPWLARPAHAVVTSVARHAWALALGVACAVTFGIGKGIATNHSFLPQWSAAEASHTVDATGVGTATQTTGKNAFLYHNATRQGPGMVGFSLEIRSHKIKSLVLWLDNGDANSDFVKPEPCRVSPTWTTCQVTRQATTSQKTSFVIGGYGAWLEKDSHFQTRNLRYLGVSQAENWLDLLKDSGRIQGFSYSPNAFAATLVLLAFVAFVQVPMAGARLGIFVLVAIGVFFSGSRNAALGLGILLVLALMLQIRSVLQSSRRIRQSVQLFSLFLASLVVAGLFAVGPLRVLKIDQDFFASRNAVFQIALEAIGQNPIFGVANPQAAMVAAYQNNPKHQTLLPPSEITHAHNMWLWLLLNVGILGTVPIVLLFFWMLWQGLRHNNRFVVVVTLGFLVLNIFDNFVFYAPFQLVWAALLFVVFQNQTSAAKGFQ